MGLVVPAVLVALIPIGALTSAAFDSSLRHRSRFGLRLAGFLLGAALPELLVIAGAAVGLVADDPAMPLLIGLMWGLTMLVLAPVLLFEGPGQGRGGSSDNGGDGPGPDDDRPSPKPPTGGLPLPDAEQSDVRLRGPGRLKRGWGPRRRTREPGRPPARPAQPR